MSNIKKHLAPTPLNVDFSRREPSKKIIGIFFLQKNCWKKHCLKWPKMAENAILTQLIIFFLKKVWKMTRTGLPHHSSVDTQKKWNTT